MPMECFVDEPRCVDVGFQAVGCGLLAEQSGVFAFYVGCYETGTVSRAILCFEHVRDQVLVLEPPIGLFAFGRERRHI